MNTAPASYFRRFWLFAHIAVMVSLLFGTVHPVQPSVSTRGTGGRATPGSRFDFLWSDLDAISHEGSDVTIDEGRVAVVVAADLQGASSDAADEAPTEEAMPAVSTVASRLFPDTSWQLLGSSDVPPARSRSSVTPLGRAPPRS